MLLDSLLARRRERPSTRRSPTTRPASGPSAASRRSWSPRVRGRLRDWVRKQGSAGSPRVPDRRSCLRRRHGLGTIQVLAHLASLQRGRPRARQARRRLENLENRRWRSSRKSLVFNWKDEAAQSSPRPAQSNLHGAASGTRASPVSKTEADLIVTTYGTRGGISLKLKDPPVRHGDPRRAQAIKNANSHRRQGVSPPARRTTASP